jgi:hypothetical protein
MQSRHGRECHARNAGLARPTKLGSRLGKKATEWRLTFLRCDLTGDSPRTEWEQRPRFCEVNHETTKGQPRNHSGDMRSATKPQNQNSSMTDPSMRSAAVTHIDIYQGTGCAGTAPMRTSPPLLAAKRVSKIILVLAGGHHDGQLALVSGMFGSHHISPVKGTRWAREPGS